MVGGVQELCERVAEDAVWFEGVESGERCGLVPGLLLNFLSPQRLV